MEQEEIAKREIALNHYLQARLIEAQIKKYGKPVVVFERVEEVKR